MMFPRRILVLFNKDGKFRLYYLLCDQISFYEIKFVVACFLMSVFLKNTYPYLDRNKRNCEDGCVSLYKLAKYSHLILRGKERLTKMQLLFINQVSKHITVSLPSSKVHKGFEKHKGSWKPEGVRNCYQHSYPYLETPFLYESVGSKTFIIMNCIQELLIPPSPGISVSVKHTVEHN